MFLRNIFGNISIGFGPRFRTDFKWIGPSMRELICRFGRGKIEYSAVGHWIWVLNWAVDVLGHRLDGELHRREWRDESLPYYFWEQQQFLPTTDRPSQLLARTPLLYSSYRSGFVRLQKVFSFSRNSNHFYIKNGFLHGSLFVQLSSSSSKKHPTGKCNFCGLNNQFFRARPTKSLISVWMNEVRIMSFVCAGIYGRRCGTRIIFRTHYRS